MNSIFESLSFAFCFLEEEKELDRDVVSDRLRDDVVCLYMIKEFFF
jgi:hypothetical protein